MRLGTLTLAGQRREAAKLAATALRRQRDAEDHRRVALRTLESRIARPESLILAFVSGMAIGMLAPQGRRDQPTEQRRPPSRNLALHKLLKIARTYLMSEFVKGLS